MKKLSLLVILALAASASAAMVVEDFESGWAGAGALVADPDDASNTVLHLVGGESVAIAMSGTGIVSMDIYDFGSVKFDEGAANPGNDYGPRFGVAGVGASVAATIINKSFLNCSMGYGWGTETSRTGSWWSPQYFGGPRNVDSLAVIGAGTASEPETPGDGAWTTWTFVVSPGGVVSFDDAAYGGSMQIQDIAMGELVEAWISGGRAHATAGELAVAGVLVDNVSFVP